MESQPPNPVGHTLDQDPHGVGSHSVVEDEGHEPKSMMQKVKDKAKKIKHKLHLDGHGQEHGLEHEHQLEHDYSRDARGGYEEEDDEDEEDGEMVQDPEIHGAPSGGYEEEDDEDEEDEEMVQDPEIHGAPSGGHEEVDEEDEEMVQDPEIHGAPINESAAIPSSIPAQPQAPNFENPTATLDYPRTPAGSMKDENPGHHGEEESPSSPRIGVLTDLQENPHGPNPAARVSPPNYESKVVDPTGEPEKAADTDPSLITSLDKMTVSDQVPGKQETAYTGSHDQLAPQRTPIGQEQGSGYVEKISVATSLIADKAISAKNAVASKLGYGNNKPQPEENPGPGSSEYDQNVAATVKGTLAPVHGKVADAGSSVGSGSGDVGAPDKGVSVTEYLAEKLRPGDDDKALSNMISETLHLSKVSDVAKAGESHPTPVTESEEVRRDLGSGMENRREGELAIAAGKENTGGGSGGVMDRVKGAVSWMGKQWEQGSGTADSPSHVGNEGAEVGEKAEFGGDQERRLQGPGN